MTELAPLMIFKKIADVMRDIEAISKTRKNVQQGYSFRGIDDVYNVLHPILAKHGVFTVPRVLEDRTEDRVSKSGAVLIYRVLRIEFRFYAEDGSSLDCVVIGEGMDSGDKASNKAMAVAHKYALTQVFCIPTQEAKDPEVESHHVYDMPYNPERLEDKQWLAAELQHQGIDKEHWKTISDALRGRVRAHLTQILV